MGTLPIRVQHCLWYQPYTSNPCRRPLGPLPCLSKYLVCCGRGWPIHSSCRQRSSTPGRLGFVAASVFMYLFYRTAKRIIVERQITPRHLARWSFQALCFFYLMFINANIMVVRSAVRIVEFTLSHLHVPRFH